MNRTKLFALVSLIIFIGLSSLIIKIFTNVDIKPSSITGEISYKDKRILPADSTLQIELINLNDMKIISHVSSNVSETSPPFKYNLTYQKEELAIDTRYGLRVNITANGEVLYSTDKEPTVITFGEVVANTNVVLSAQQASTTETVTCPKETKTCADGSVVRKIAPSCTFTACPSATSTNSSTKITASKWLWLKTIAGEETVIANDDSFLMTVSDTELKSETDCNSITGQVTINGNNISSEEILITEMFCENSQDLIYEKYLEKMQSFTIENNSLEINLEDGGVMFFERI